MYVENQLFDVVEEVEGADEVAVELELELPLELAAGVELSAGFDASAPDLLESPLEEDDEGFAEE